MNHIMTRREKKTRSKACAIATEAMTIATIMARQEALLGSGWGLKILAMRRG